MLTENINVRQIVGEPFRRWFYDECFDLIVWFDKSNHIIGFQICYDKHRNEHAITWNLNTGFSHETIDSGDQSVFNNRSPILNQDGIVPVHSLLKAFVENSSTISQDISDYIIEKLNLLLRNNKIEIDEVLKKENLD